MYTPNLPDPLVGEETAWRIRRLLNLGVSHAEVRHRTGVSRRVIDRIARGRFVPGQTRPLDPALEPIAHRCDGCGAMIYRWPCLACQAASRSPAAPKSAAPA